MAGYWSSSFLLFCLFMDRSGVAVHEVAEKEREKHLAILTE